MFACQKIQSRLFSVSRGSSDEVFGVILGQQHMATTKAKSHKCSEDKQCGHFPELLGTRSGVSMNRGIVSRKASKSSHSATAAEILG